MALVPPDQFGFCGATYLEVSPVIDSQRSINLYPEVGVRTSKTQLGLVGRPGLSSTWGTLPTSPARTLWAGSGRLFAVGGDHFYELHANGTVLKDYGAMAGSGSTGPCTVLANGTQLLVCDPSTPKVYNADPVAPAMTGVFNGVALEYLDGFYIAIATGASLAGANPNQINSSNFLDGTTWNALNYVIRTGTADLPTQLATVNNLLWVFGEKSIDIWYNAGNAGFPFARVNGGTINLGLLAPATVVKFYNTVLWLGADDRGYAQVYMAQGMNPVRVSNAAIENLLLGLGVAATALVFSFAFGYQESGHTFYVLNLTSVQYGIPSATIVYDLTTGLWHERVYAGFWPCCFASVPSLFASSPIGSPHVNFVGDANSGKISAQAISYPSDAGTAITYTRTSPHVAHDNQTHRYNRFELDCDIGTAGPTLDYSNDGGRNFRGLTTALMHSTDGIAPGSFKRFYAQQLGISRDRVFKTTITDSTNLIRIASAILDVD